MVEETSSRYAINSILRANAVLQCLAEEADGLRIRDLTERLNFDRTTVFRLVSTLETCGYVERVPETKAYKLGVGIYQIGSAYLRSTDLLSVVRPVMIELSRTVQESVHWAILSGDSAVFIDKIHSPRCIGAPSKIGRALPLNSGSVGKVLLAFQPAEVRERLLTSMEMPRFTERTITTVEEMRREIEAIRRAGHSLSLGEREPDLACIAAPIFDHTSRMIAGLNIGGSVQRFSDAEQIDAIRTALIGAARQISKKMGCPAVPTFEDAA